MIAHLITAEHKPDVKPIDFDDLQIGQLVETGDNSVISHRLKINIREYIRRNSAGEIYIHPRTSWPIELSGVVETVKMIWEIQ